MSTTPSLRWVLPLIGAVAAAFFWLLVDVLPDHFAEKRWLLLLVSLVTGTAATLLVTVGPLKVQRAWIYALGIGGTAGLLLFWNSWRFLAFGGFIDAAHPIFAFALLVSLTIPFAIATETAPDRWRDYEALFDHAWSIFVRSLTAWAFTGLFWLVLFLSDALLSLVGFTYIGEVIKVEFVWMVLSGSVLGLALAVLDEMKTVVSTMRRLALLLLRLLLPMVALVVALFILLVPFQGLGRVFGSFSAAATMLAMAAGGVSLITAAVEARDSDAAVSRLMVLAAKGLSLLLPIVTGIALWAIWLRVGQYGWTPSRLAGALVALVMFGYALTYAVAILRGKAWRATIRHANIAMALVAITLSALWLSPVLNAERITANSHVKRFLSERISVRDLEIHKLGKDWGKAGQAALERLRGVENPPEAEAFREKLAAYDEGKSEWEIRQNTRTRLRDETLEKLARLMPLRTEDARDIRPALAALNARQLETILLACQRLLPDGAPGCVAISYRAQPNEAGQDVVLFYRRKRSEQVDYLSLLARDNGNGYIVSTSLDRLGGDLFERTASALLPALQAGEFKIAPARLNAIELNGMQILPRR